MRIINFLKRYWLFILLAFLATLVVLIRFFFAKPQEPGRVVPKPTPSFAPLIKIEGVPITGQLKIEVAEFPTEEKLFVYKGIPQKLNDSKVREIAVFFGFKGEPIINQEEKKGTIYIWSFQEKYLIVEAGTPRILYGIDLLNNPQLLTKEGSLPTKDEAEEKLKNLYSTLKLSPQFKNLWSQTERYLRVRGPIFEETIPFEAELIEAGFGQKIDKFPVLGLDPERPLLRLMLDKNNQIVQFEYQILSSDFQVREEYLLKTKTETENSLRNEGRIVAVNLPIQETTTFRFVSGALNQAEIIYFQPPEPSELIQPVFLLKGEVTLEDGTTTQIVVYLPAIRS